MYVLALFANDHYDARESTSPLVTMAGHALPFVCQNCGAANDHRQAKCEACGELTPRPSFASLLMSIPFGDFERYRSPFRDLDL
jgi:predicted RNA-binding Zn-ribbon protein involved in translation (DUF1610 family)